MKNIINPLLVYPLAIFKMLFPAFIVALCCHGCSKNEQTVTVGKPANITKNFQFNIRASNQFDEEASKNISLKLRLSISHFSPGMNSKRLLWDTLVSRHNLYEFTHSADEKITTSLKGTTDTFDNLLLNYTIIYNDQGALITRSETANLKESELENLVVKL